MAAHEPKVVLLDSRPRVDAWLRHCATGVKLSPGETETIGLAQWLERSDSDGEIAFKRAAALQLPLALLTAISGHGDLLAEFTGESARSLHAVPLLHREGFVVVALEDPGNAESLSKIEFLSPYRVIPVVASRNDIRAAIVRWYGEAEDAAMAVQLGLGRLGDNGNSIEMERIASEQPVVRLIADLIEDAISRRASDIHFRPGEYHLDALYRIDDELVPMRRFLRSLAPALVSRVKVLGRMNLAEHRVPQDGRCSFTRADGRQVDLRISVLPTVHGESVVLRLLDTEESLKTLGQIGLTPADQQCIDALMQRSHGMFLTTGPTGCGKSTTLYAMLLEMRQQRINILSIEDPVEFHIEDIQQMQVNRAAGFTFASALRSFLRHDPDSIMVGEIRDAETADIAVESALTGHLVLSTLHTNTAATTVTRLLDLGVEAFLLRVSLLAVMAQRLVRLTCAHCREVEPVDAYVRDALGAGTDEVFYIGRGCARCNGLGVFRRSAVYELLTVTPAIRRLIVPHPDADAIQETAIREGMLPITQAALALARCGKISLSEAFRVRAD